jgi:hypothetical protein
MAIQVFEYLSTDLKKFMDRTGKGNANPMPQQLIKVPRVQQAALLQRHNDSKQEFCHLSIVADKIFLLALTMS